MLVDPPAGANELECMLETISTRRNALAPNNGIELRIPLATWASRGHASRFRTLRGSVQMRSHERRQHSGHVCRKRCATGDVF